MDGTSVAMGPSASRCRGTSRELVMIHRKSFVPFGRAARLAGVVSTFTLAACAADTQSLSPSDEVGGERGPDSLSADDSVDTQDQISRGGGLAGRGGIGGVLVADPVDLDPQATLLASGTGWQRFAVRGAMTDPDTGAVRDANDEVVVIRGAKSIDTSPLGAKTKTSLKADFRASAASGKDEDDDTIYFVHKPTADAIEAAPQQPGNVALFSSCNNYDKTYSRHVSGSKAFSHHLGTQSGNFTGSADFDGNVSGDVNANVVLRIKRTQTYILGCQTYAAAFKRLDVAGNASAHGHVKVDGRYEREWHYSKQVAKPSLGSFDFWAGPIPVHVGFNLPIDVGMDASALATVNADVDVTGNGNFAIQCTKDDCDGSKNVTYGFTNNKTPTASVSAKVDVTPWVQASVRGYLYSESIAYAQVGVKPKLPSSLFFYYGNQCGDGDGDGTNEWVRALTLDVGVGVDVTAKVSLLGSSVWSHDWSVLGRKSVGFWDLMPGGSSALSPMLKGSRTPLTSGMPTSSLYQARVSGGMRPCWPYADALTYTMAWGDGSTETINMPAGQLFVRDHGYGSKGLKTLALTTVRDAAGRTIGKTTTSNIVPFMNLGQIIETPDLVAIDP